MKLSNEPKQHYYTEDFFQQLQESSRQSAEEIVPLILDMIPCNRLIDVGCGDGTWLKVFQEHGVKEILGIDGSYVNEKVLVIPKENFLPFDLTKPLKIDEQFDMVVSLEVAEHLPAECAESFIDSLTSLGSVILFSAAIPYQGGENHINEQWAEYWINLFHAKNYVGVDCIRRKIWNNRNVAPWYSQNIFIFVEESYLENNLTLKKELESSNASFYPVVHPGIYIEANMKLIKAQEALAEKIAPEQMSLKSILQKIPKLTKNYLNWRLNSFLKKI